MTYYNIVKSLLHLSERLLCFTLTDDNMKNQLTDMQ